MSHILRAATSVLVTCVVALGAAVSVAFAQTVPVITWSSPAAIDYGTGLSVTQLNAAADTAGTFVYTPDFGTVLHAGTDQTLHVVFTPTDLEAFSPTSAEVLLTVNKRLINPTATGINKVYDGTTDASSVITTDKLSGDDISIFYVQQLFDDPTVGIAKSISLAGPSISGLSANDYDLIASRISTTADITKATAGIALTHTSQQFDGTAKSIDVATDPVGLGTAITYDGASALPTAVGPHAVRVVIDDANYEGVATTTLYITDGLPPVITLTGLSDITLPEGTPYADAGATASDDADGDLTSSIVTSNAVNTVVVGTYVITYDVSDSSDNPAPQVIRTVHVVAPVVSSGGGGGGGGGGGNGPLSGFALGTSSALTAPFLGQVLAAATSTVECGPLITKNLRRGRANDEIEVMKLKSFLNIHMGTMLPMNGAFGPLTESAVKKFQVKYAADILAPVGITKPTGFVLAGTRAKIHTLNCGK